MKCLGIPSMGALNLPARPVRTSSTREGIDISSERKGDGMRETGR